jgi:Indoleamine 2,3-dioxygenase
VAFEGVNDGARTHLRGETGAQSSIIPSCDCVLGITHKADALRSMLEELEAYRPKGHRDYLTSLRLSFYGADCGAGGQIDGAAPHALRDAVAGSGSPSLVRAFNDCVGLVWAFRDVHVTFADMYISRFTRNANATGGTPFKAYLRKHRDESMAHQLRIDGMGPETLCAWSLAPTAEVDAQVDAALEDTCENGIPAFLMQRHADIVAAHPSPSLLRKAYPVAGQSAFLSRSCSCRVSDSLTRSRRFFAVSAWNIGHAKEAAAAVPLAVVVDN